MKDNDDFFVGIYDPVDVRRNFLESSREIIRSLQGHEDLHNIRIQKLKRIKEMKEVMNELDMLIEKLKHKLPKSHLRKAVNVSSNYSGKNFSRKEFSSELDKLEDQLKNVESQLSRLS